MLSSVIGFYFTSDKRQKKKIEFGSIAGRCGVRHRRLRPGKAQACGVGIVTSRILFVCRAQGFSSMLHLCEVCCDQTPCQSWPISRSPAFQPHLLKGHLSISHTNKAGFKVHSIYFKKQVSCSPGWPPPLHKAEDDLEVLLLLTPHPKCWGYRCVVPCPVCTALGVKSRASSKACKPDGMLI